MGGDSLVGAAAIGAALLVGAVALFQVALALGLPLGEATLGGKARTERGVLQGVYRILAVLQAGVLLLFAWIILARADILAFPLGGAVVGWATWVVAVFLALNTLANLTAPHPVERRLMGSVTIVTFLLVVAVAWLAPST